jgi:alpha-tubulin suppressor-like RCC1 family protein
MTNYNINNVDLDDSPYNFSSYINVSDGNYTNVSAINITARKTVIFGQNALTNVHPIGKLGNAFNTAQDLNVPKIDIDGVSVLATMPTAVVFSDTKKSQYYIRGNFALAENNANILATLQGTTFRLFPQYIGGNVSSDFSVWTKISNGSNYSLAIQSNGTLWAWGYNDVGQLGLGDQSNRSSPIQIGNITTWKILIGGNVNSNLAIQSNGTLWSWGSNSFGQLGLGDQSNRSIPIQVGSLSVWTQISAGAYHSLSIQSNGTLWSWGYNPSGQLGLFDTTNRSSPVQIGSLSLWTRIAAGASHSLAIQSDGTLWSWGFNQTGQLGSNNTANRNSPVQLGSLSVWTKISGGSYSTAAIQSNGTLWAWGANSYGQLGLSDQTNRYSPVQVGALLWKEISTVGESSLAIQSNGTLWTWGRNEYGQLGLSDITDRYSPVQVGNLSTWTQISNRQDNSLALQSDGTLWAWGRNNFGTVGDSIIFTNPPKPVYGV